MDKAKVARIWYALIALQVIVVVPARAVISWRDIDGEFSTSAARGINVFCFFTIQSNIIVAVVCILLAINYSRDSTRFVIWRHTALVCILVTGIVYHVLLASTDHNTGLAVPANFAFHTSVPIMFALGWWIFNHHGNTTWRTVRFSLIFPIAWAIFAMIRGAIIHYYPYPFMDVRDLGYSGALINMAFVTAFFVGLFIGAFYLDNRLARTKSSAS